MLSKAPFTFPLFAIAFIGVTSDVFSTVINTMLGFGERSPFGQILIQNLGVIGVFVWYPVEFLVTYWLVATTFHRGILAKNQLIQLFYFSQCFTFIFVVFGAVANNLLLMLTVIL